jgi:2-polyprenyl-6-methoxyphenol hydroxylase-like FAD-dependent oxidoreductase
MPNQQYHAKVLIAGGSIAGLTLANALEQAGVDYLVLEKYKHIAPDVGASICIFPNGFKILDQLGCYERIKELASDADSFRSVTMRNMCGKAIIEVPEASRQIEKRYEGVFRFFMGAC